jgi:hypothetical protein
MQLPVTRRSVHNHDSHLHPRLASRVLVLMHTFTGNLQVIKKPCQLLMWASRLTSRDSVLHAAIMHQYCSVLALCFATSQSAAHTYSTVLRSACPIQSQSLAQQVRPHCWQLGTGFSGTALGQGWSAPQPIMFLRAATNQLMTGSQPGITSCVLVLPPYS